MLQAKVAIVFLIMFPVLPGIITIAAFDSYDLAMRWINRPRKWPR